MGCESGGYFKISLVAKLSHTNHNTQERQIVGTF